MQVCRYHLPTPPVRLLGGNPPERVLYSRTRSTDSFLGSESSLPGLYAAILAQAIDEESQTEQHAQARVDGHAEGVEDAFLVHPRRDQAVYIKAKGREAITSALHPKVGVRDAGVYALPMLSAASTLLNCCRLDESRTQQAECTEMAASATVWRLMPRIPESAHTMNARREESIPEQAKGVQARGRLEHGDPPRGLAHEVVAHVWVDLSNGFPHRQLTLLFMLPHHGCLLLHGNVPRRQRR